MEHQEKIKQSAYMNKLNALKQAAFVAVLGMATVSWADDQNTTTPPATDANGQQMAQPSKANKASSLVGMDVKNPQGESLGKIEDIVINPRTERVAYCVLGQRETILSKQKLLAVPLRAFQPSADGDYLILNANKNNLAEAQGFSKDNWPSVDAQRPWGAQPFWQKNPTERQTEPNK